MRIGQSDSVGFKAQVKSQICNKKIARIPNYLKHLGKDNLLFDFFEVEKKHGGGFNCIAWLLKDGKKDFLDNYRGFGDGAFEKRVIKSVKRWAQKVPSKAKALEPKKIKSLELI